jgi:DNA-binding MarR family transcriptional regulator
VNQDRIEMPDELLDPADLDLFQLALFAGMAANDAIRARLEHKGFLGLRDSHGFVVQHLLREPQSIGELAAQLGITQQAVSKSVAELARNGYVQDAPSSDGRVRKLRLSPRGKSMVQFTRSCRREVEAQLAERVGKSTYDQAKQVILAALDQLDALGPIRHRKVRP